MKKFKKGTEALTFVGFALMVSAFVNINLVCGLIAAGIFTFLFIYDPSFRGMF